MTHIIFQDSDIMVERKHIRVRQMMKFVSPLSFLIVLFMILVLYQSLVDIKPPPLQTGESHASAKAGVVSTVVTYSRHVTIEEDVIAVVSRSLACQGYSTFDFPEVTRKYEEGDRVGRRALVVHYRIPPGTQCQLLSSYRYKPTFSIPWHHVQVPPLSVVVEEFK